MFDKNGDISERQTAVVGDVIRLSKLGSGRTDWVKIIEIIDEPGEAILTVKPSYDPTEKGPKGETNSYFFASDSTNSFCLEKTDAIVSFYVIGRSEGANPNKTGTFIQKARKLAVSKVAAYFEIQKGEWKTFCANFLRLTDGENRGGPANTQESISP